MENLANLDQIGDGLFTLFALPLRYQDADGSPFGRWRSWTGRNEHGAEVLYQPKGEIPDTALSPLTGGGALERASRFHKFIPGYAPTPWSRWTIWPESWA